jgi:hypothetical protein
MSLLRKFFGPQAVTSPAPTPAAPEAAARDDSEDRLAAALALPEVAEREAALLALAGNSRLSTVRLKAASALTSADSWQSLMQTAQDRDRRVWKLMKDRLSGARQQVRAGSERDAIAKGLEDILAKRPVDLVRLVDLDKRWEAIQNEVEAGPLADLRSQVSARIEAEQKAQFELRRIITAATKGEAAVKEPGTEAAALEAEAKELSAALAAIDPTDAPPAQLLEAQGRVAAFNDAVGGAKVEHELHEQGRVRARELLGQVERLEAASLELCQNLEADWQQVKLGSHAEDEDLKQRFTAGLATLKAPHAEAEAQAKAKAQQQGADKKVMQERLRTLITETEAALEQGAAAIAIKLNDEMRVLRNAVGALSPGWKTRLSAAEKQVAKLRGWQRYTGEKLREELINAAEKLKDNHLTPDLLAKEITLLQDEWKKLDTQQEGGAPKSMWERFHAATSLAYERVKVFKDQQAKEREANAEKRRALIAEAQPISQMFVEGATPTPEAWKTLASQRASLHDRWQAAGPVNRAEMKELQGQFAAHMKALDAAANFARKQEKERKNALIAEVDAALQAAIAAIEATEKAPAPAEVETATAAPAPVRSERSGRNERADRNERSRGGDRNDRGGRDDRRGGPPNRAGNVPPQLLNAMRIAQDAQKRWQEQRHPMPLPRKEEQQLWETFRAKCSAIFALRDAKREEEKGKAAAQEGARAQVINNVIALAEAADPVAANAHLSQLFTEWNAMERPDHGARRRFDEAVARARARIDSLKREAAAAIAGKMLAFDTELCKLEQAQAEGGTVDAAPLAAQMEELGKPLSRHKGLKARAERVIKGGAVPADWSKLMAAGSASRATLLLDLELTLGVESPPEFAAARRTRQMERLADAMKNRAAARSPEEMLDALLALPASPSEGNVVRLAAIVANLEKPKR